MPNRRARGRAARERGEHPELDVARLLGGARHTEVRRGREWTVQPISASRAQKPYRCPGCERMISPGEAHLATWRADGVLGDAADLADRRHWHTACWAVS